MNKKPIEPVSPEQREKLLTLQGAIILGEEPGSNTFQGYVEHSFLMGWDKQYVNFFWCSDGIDGVENAEGYTDTLRSDYPHWNIEMWNVHDPELPVILDWESWIEAQAYNPNTLSGVTNKFKARNLSFQIKDGEYFK